MPRDEHWLGDIRDAATAISGFLTGLDKDAFLASDLVRSAVLHKLTIVGEAANRLTPELKAAYPQVPWRETIGFRNVIVHAYFTVDWDVVWRAATKSLPALVEDLSEA
jgi:uncharacterized protein with HEPN domain